MALKKLDVAPHECVFLDDLGNSCCTTEFQLCCYSIGPFWSRKIGANLSGARKLGIQTIKVGLDETLALRQLQQLIGVDLALDPQSRL
jgi:FMN phosphatase YigB (HAD superfamily)